MIVLFISVFDCQSSNLIGPSVLSHQTENSTWCNIERPRYFTSDKFYMHSSMRKSNQSYSWSKSLFRIYHCRFEWFLWSVRYRVKNLKWKLCSSQIFVRLFLAKNSRFEFQPQKAPPPYSCCVWRARQNTRQLKMPLYGKWRYLQSWPKIRYCANSK